MKKVALFLMIACLGVAGYVSYLFFFKSYDTADQTVDNLAESEYDLAIPNEVDLLGENGAKPSKQQIIQPFRSSYDSMIAEAEERMDQIAAEAAKEYMRKKQSNKTISYSYFYSKYTSAADRLEKSTDQAFQDIYQPMKSSLEKNGYSFDSAEGLKGDYEQTKKRWRSNLLSEAKEAF